MTRYLTLLMLVLVGCASPLESTTEVTKPRVLGAVISVVSEPLRSTPAPLENVRVELVVADPGPRLGRSFAFIVCAPSDTQFDVGACETPLVAPIFVGLPADGAPKPAPAFEFQVPDEATLGEAKALRVLGGVCAGGDLDLNFDPNAFQGAANADSVNPCADKENEGRLITFEIALERSEADRNYSPQIASITFGTEQSDWTAVAGEDDPAEGCAGGALPQVVATGATEPIDMSLVDGSRETYTNDRDPPEEVVEAPFVAFHGTAGDFTGAYSFFDDTPLSPTLLWQHPPASDVPDDGLLVRFWFVLRDGRGGQTYLERALCMVKASAP